MGQEASTIKRRHDTPEEPIPRSAQGHRLLGDGAPVDGVRGPRQPFSRPVTFGNLGLELGTPAAHGTLEPVQGGAVLAAPPRLENMGRHFWSTREAGLRSATAHHPDLDRRSAAPGHGTYPRVAVAAMPSQTVRGR